MAGLTAAEAGGLTGWERDTVHLLVARGVHVPPLLGLVVHESRRFTSDDIHPVRLPRQTRMPRSLVDGASWLARPEHACAVLASGVQQRLARVTGLRVELDKTGRVRHREIMRHVLGDIEGGAHAFSEISLVRLCRRHGLRVPDEQQFRLEGQRQRYLDAVWRLPDGRLLVLEVDGGLHLRVGTWWQDLARERDVVLRAGMVLRCSTVELRLAPDTIAADLARAGIPRSR